MLLSTFARIMPNQDFGHDRRTGPLASRGGTLRALAVSCDQEHGAAQACGDLWQRLRAGDLCVADTFSTEERAYLLLEQRALRAGRVAPRHWDILERILLGQSQKVVALELDVAVSTIAGSAKAALRALGIHTRVSNVPPLLCVLAQASLKHHAVGAIRAAALEDSGVRYRVLSIARKNALLVERLSPAEQVVALMRIEGRSIADIASCRRTSRRTVANQLGAAFRRLGLSGRSSLVEYFLHPEASSSTSFRACAPTDASEKVLHVDGAGHPSTGTAVDRG